MNAGQAANPILARAQSLAHDGLHPMAVRVSAAGRGKWTVTITLDDVTTPEEAADPRFPPVDRSTLPPGVKVKGFVRFPDDVSHVSGSAEAVETWIAEVARVGKAIDWARFDPTIGPAEGYPTYLTKPAKWLKPSNPHHPDNFRNPANKFPGFPAHLRSLRETTGLSVEQLADAAGLTRQAVSRYELGQRSPTWDAVQSLARALSTTTDTFRDS
jgi:DNA-binding XRE family transcriptional regulator